MTLSLPGQRETRTGGLLEQHESWSEAHARLVSSPAPATTSKATERPVSPFRRERVARTVAAIRQRPELAAVFPGVFSTVTANYLPSAFIYLTGSPPTPTWKIIAREVAAKHSLRLADLLSVRRDRESVRARHECFWRCKNETAYTLPQIGRYFGGRDHTTVLHGIRKHQERMAQAQ